MTYNYEVYGLSLSVDKPIYGLLESAASPFQADVYITVAETLGSFADLAWQPHHRFVNRRTTDSNDPPTLRILESEDARFTRLHYIDDTNFIFDSDMTHIWVSLPFAPNPEYVGTNLLDPLLGFYLSLREQVCLHASAVEIDGRGILIVGGSGFGKSTLATFFASSGHPIISDNLSVLLEQGEQVNIQPGYPLMRLWPESIEVFGSDSDTFPRIIPELEKRYFNLSAEGYAFSQSPLPIGAIYVLRKRGDFTRIAKFAPSDAVMKLMDFSYMSFLIDAQLRQIHFKAISHLVETVPVFDVSRRAGLEYLPDLYESILANLRAYSG